MYVDLAGVVRSKVVNGLRVPTLFPMTEEQQRAIGAFVDAIGKPFCTGTLIQPHVVLSAAHCAVVPGDTFAVGPDLGQPEGRATVTDVVRHPVWAGTVRDHLLARLDRPLAVEPIAVGGPPAVSASVQGVGYGLVDPEAEANLLRWWVVEPVTVVSDGWFAVDGQGQRGLCNGDSGGPALVSGPTIAGTVSQGAVSCVGEDLYSVVDPAWVQSVLASWLAPGVTTRTRILSAALPIGAVVVMLAVTVAALTSAARSRRRAAS